MLEVLEIVGMRSISGLGILIAAASVGTSLRSVLLVNIGRIGIVHASANLKSVLSTNTGIDRVAVVSVLIKLTVMSPKH